MGRVSIIFNNTDYPVTYDENGTIGTLKNYIAVRIESISSPSRNKFIFLQMIYL